MHDRLAQAQEYRDSAAASRDSAAGAQPTMAIPATPGSPETPGSAEDATRVLGSPRDETTILSGPAHTVAFGGTVGPEATAGHTQAMAPQRPLSARQARKNAKAAEIAWKKDAQIPTHELAPKTPARRKWLLGILLVLLATIVTAAGLFFGMGPGAPFQIPTLTGLTGSQAAQQLLGGRRRSWYPRRFRREDRARPRGWK